MSEPGVLRYIVDPEDFFSLSLVSKSSSFMLFEVDELWVLVSVLVAVLLWNANWYWVVGI